MTVSTAKVEITPPSYSYMAGYATTAGFRLATGSYSPMYARCVVFRDEGAPHAMVSIDTVGFGRTWHQSIRPRLNALADWDAADVVLLATHTHNGPMPDTPDPGITYGVTDLESVAAYGTWLADRVVALVARALAEPQVEVTLDYRVTSQTWSGNRANLPYAETAVPVLVARDIDDQPVAVLFQYGAHPVAAGVQDRWDGDYPAAACAVVEATIPSCLALFVPGPAGDQNPVGNPGWPLRNRLGSQLGAAVVAAIGDVGRPLGGPVLTAYTEVDLPLDVPDDVSGLAAVRAAYATRLSTILQPAWYPRHAQAMIDQIDDGSFASSIVLPITVWKLAGSPMLRMAFCAGELVSGYAVYYRSRYGGPNGLMMGGYGNEACCYLCGDEFFPPFTVGGSYEGGWDVDNPAIAGGAMTVYGAVGHFRSRSPQSVEALVVAGLDALLA